MSWSYSLALVVEFSAQCCSDTEPFAQLNTTPTPDQFYWPDKTTEHSRLSRFGMTCVPLMGSLGGELLTWCQEVSRAKTYQSLAKAPDLMENDQVCGEKWRESLAKYDPNTHSLKTAQLSLIEDLTGCCVTLPRWGLMRDGELYQQPMLAHFTVENESGSSLPTPCATDAGSGRFNTSVGSLNARPTLAMMAKRNLWPTATATAYKGWSPNHNRANTDDRLDYSVERVEFVPGQTTPPMRLNPEWVEWLMGWPIGQTALKPLETGRFQEFEQQHGGY